MSQAKKSVFEPVMQMYTTWYDQYEKGLNEVEAMQKKSLESAYGMMEKAPAMEMLKMNDSVATLKSMQMNAVNETYGMVRKTTQEMRKQSMQWMANVEAMMPAMSL